jgi:hypothetical protein
MAKAKPPASPRTRYEDDVYTWVLEQVALLQAGRLTEIDALNIAEELADVAKAELRALTSTIAVLTQHLLTWDHQQERRSRSWELSIREQRARITDVIVDSPGLKSRLSDAIERGYRSGRNAALEETKFAENAMPEKCPYTSTRS